MAEYGKVYKKIWNNERFAGLSDSAKLLFIYLCTNQHCNLLGLYVLHIGYIMGDLKWSENRVKSNITALNSRGLIEYDKKRSLMFIESWFEHNPLTSELQTRKALAELTEIPKSVGFLSKLRTSLLNGNNDFCKMVLTEIDKWFERKQEDGSNSVSVSVSETVSETETVLSESNSDHREAIKYFTDLYEKEIGAKYHFRKGKDGQHIKDLLKTFNLKQLKALIDQLFESKDKFIVSEAGRTLGVLKSCSNKLVQEIKNSALKGFSPKTQASIRNITEVVNE